MKRWILGVAVVGVGGCLHLFARQQLSDTASVTSDCLRDVTKSGTGRAEDCRRHAWLASLVPWTHWRAARLSREVDGGVAAIAAELASQRDLDREARDRAVETLLADPDDAWLDALGPQHAESRIWWAARTGATTPVVAHARDVADGCYMRSVVSTAFRGGETTPLAAIAAIHTPDRDECFAKLRGELLCVLGDLDGAHAAFALADHDEHDHDEIARLDALCNPHHVLAGKDAAEAWSAFVGGGPAGRADPAPHGIAALAASLATLHEHEDAAALEAVLEEVRNIANSRLDYAVTPWTILADHELLSDTQPASPARDDATAAWIGSQSPIAAELVALHATGAWSRRGDLARAKASLATALGYARDVDPKGYPTARVLVAPYQHLVGDLDGALATLDAAGELPERVVYSIAIERALLSVDRGDLERAWSIAVDAARTQTNQFMPPIEAMWLEAGLAVRLHRAVPRPLSTEHVWRGPAAYYELATAPAAELPVRRWGPRDEQGSAELLPDAAGAASVLPVALYLMSASAGSGDAETWLDAIEARVFVVENPIRFALARSDVARWRGNTAAAEQWRTRVAALQKLAATDRGDFLLNDLMWRE